jgi:uncharacterized membrane protein YbhN (UPF0104 family)
MTEGGRPTTDDRRSETDDGRPPASLVPRSSLPAKRQASNVKRRVRGVVQITISLVLMALILRRVHWDEVSAALRSIEPIWLAMAWGLFLLGVVVRAERWSTLLHVLGIH